MTTLFIQNTGASFKQYNLSKSLPTGLAPYTHVIAFPAKSVNSSGIFTKNAYLSYLGVESGKYPFVLDPADPFNGVLEEKEIFFDSPININSNTSGLFCNVGPGDGLYLIAD